MTINNQRVVIFGGTSGIGLAVATAALAEGAAVTIASRSKARVDEALATLGPGADGRVIDTASESAIRDFFEEASSFDHLVYTAGEALQLLTIDSDLASFRQFFEVRYWGALAAVKHGHGKIRPGGSIVLTSGTAAARPMGAGWVAASSICAAMEGMIRALAIELRPLRINSVAPGVVKTPLWSGMTDADRQSLYVAEAARLPVGHAGDPTEVAAAYVYLMGQTYVTGQVLHVDGGGLLV